MDSQNIPEGSESDIAIVGMAGRFAGAGSAAEYWKNLAAGVESIRDYTEAELIEAGESPDRVADPRYVRRGAPLDEVEAFDGAFFGLGPKDSAIMDPQHRHFIECAWESFEDAALLPESFDGRVGVFGGCGMGSYFYFHVCSHRDLVDSEGMFLLRHTGNDKDFLATRVSHLLDLRGPSISVQTACSTSLVAVHLACQSLLAEECDVALAGGSSVELPHRRGYVYEEGEILSSDGHCRSFDARSEGTVFGSGSGVVLLRRLSDAIADGDPIHAVIRATAVNNDGAAKAGYLAPSVDGQAAAIGEALALADVDADTIGYVECHGTGTRLGDPIEVAALTAAFRETTDDVGYCRIGSSKSNIGHTDTAAGVASLIKAAYSVEKGLIPPSLGFESPNPELRIEESPFLVNASLHEWEPEGMPRRAGVNSLGVGGTNAHCIVEEGPALPAGSASSRAEQLLCLSAGSLAALDESTDRLVDHLRANAELSLADVAHTLRVGRRSLTRRRVVVAGTVEEAATLLADRDPRRVFTHKASDDTPRAVFLFPGGGAQYPGMARRLHADLPVFRAEIERGLAILESRGETRLRDILSGASEDAAEQLLAPSVQLPLIFLVEYGLAKTLMAHGIRPDSLLGHSMGEVTAACLAGVFSFEDALGLVLLRGQLFDRVDEGGMLSVALPEAELRPLLGEALDLAAVNGPALSVASGAVAEIEALRVRLESMDVDCRRIPIDIAAHSRHLEPLLADLRARLESVAFSRPTLPVVSSRTGALLGDAEIMSVDYWVGQLRDTVRFSAGVETIAADGDALWIEVGPGRALGSLVRQHGFAPPPTVLPSLPHADEEVDDLSFFLTLLGRLRATGLDVDLGDFADEDGRRRLHLPGHAWSHKRHWIEPAAPVLVREEEALHRVDSLDAWGWRQRWVRRAPEACPSEDTVSSWLVYLDGGSLGKRLVERLRSRGHRVTTVRAGDAFARRGEDDFVIAPEQGREGYLALIRELVREGRVPDRVAHLGLTTADDSCRPGSSPFHRNLEQGFYSLLFLMQAMVEENLPRPIHVVVISNEMHDLGEGTKIRPEKATALGPVLVGPHELPGFTFSAVDVELPEEVVPSLRDRVAERLSTRGSNDSALERLVDDLEDELMAAPRVSVVALRGRHRYERELRPVKLPVASASKIRDEGTYLITGGSGGIGRSVAEHLAREHRARLVLVSRSGGGKAMATLAETIREAGGEALVLAADVTDVEAMRGALEQARGRFGAIHGVFHAAGALDDGPLTLKTLGDVDRVFAPKVHGTQILEELLEGDALDFMLLFSSTSTATAPAGQVDYVAANAFLDAHASSRDGRGGRRTLALGWGVWQGVGMAARAASGEAKRAAPLLPVEAPLIDARVDDPAHHALLVSRLSSEREWVLDGHRTLDGAAVLPGTGYLELAVEALEAVGESLPVSLEDVLFLRPLPVSAGEEIEVELELRRSEEGYGLEIREPKGMASGRAQAPYATLSLHLGGVIKSSRIDLEAIRARCVESVRDGDGKAISSPQDQRMRFGPRWSVLREERRGADEAIARLALDERFADEVPTHPLHPALLDIATGFGLALVKEHRPDEALWIPMSYGKVEVHRPLEAEVHSWARPSQSGAVDGDTFALDVTITDAAGDVLVEVERFVMKRAAEGFGDRLSADAPDVREMATASPALTRFRAQFAMGIEAAEGVEALERVLALGEGAQTYVSSMPLDVLVREAEHDAEAGVGGGASFERPELESDFVAPGDDIEKTLAGFWEDLLGVKPVGIRDDFFALGGHSLIAVRLFAMVKKAYAQDFPISILFEAPTIERCAALIRASVDAGASEASAPAESRRFKHLVPMHPGVGSSKTPFFLVAGMFGNVLNLRHLAQLVGADRPFYGVQARGLYGDEAPHETFEEMAEAYLEELREVQPHGPYLLGGFSGGGLAAYEIAQRLRAAGEEVSLLVMLDTPLPYQPALTLEDRARIQMKHLTDQGADYVKNWATSRVQWEIGKLRERFGEPVERAETEFHNERIEQAFYRALERYNIADYDGRTLLYRPRLEPAYDLGNGRALNSDRRFIYEDNGWSAHVNDLDVSEVPGNHDSMVLEPNVRVLAGRLRRAIEAAESSAERNSERTSVAAE